MRLRILVLSLLVLAAAVPAISQVCPEPTLHNCAPKNGNVIAFEGDQGPMRIRKSIWALSQKEVDELRLAFKKLRALPDEDPRSWWSQANIHCWNCAGPGSHIGPETQPEDVHATWSFLPWHRAYLYTLEKILGDLVGNPSFALPYWDWDTPDSAGCIGSHQSLPKPYVGDSKNPLWDCNRGVTPDQTMCRAAVSDRRLDFVFDHYDTFSLFFGTQSCASALWHGPHGYVHIWAGGLKNITLASGGMVTSSSPDMGMLGTAARDPVFYAHHANVDRMWELWIEKMASPNIRKRSSSRTGRSGTRSWSSCG